ncbi:MFS transporter [Pantoea sp. Lij88]|jgi:MFS family permease|uniref:MFS transporter n=1 Tax=Pantoea sp. Lij88 TaxID=3028622 RepID=UPI0024BA9073|nr:MFS transporter [Pantoea sp. Lij88]WHQ73693.1 MFS transporter [Pantoea sp. Lij88]
MKETTLAPAAALPKKNNVGVMAVIVALFLAAVDSTIVSTVLPTISQQLGHPTLWPWVMSAFLLPVALVAPLAGACGDRFGVSSTLKACLLIFLCASALAAVSTTMPILILARALQGIGAGGIIVLSYSLLAALFDAERRGKMQGMLSGVWGLSAIVGPLLGSVLDATFGWRAIFWLNIPLGLLALLLLFITPAVSKGAGKACLDLPAQGALIVATCCLLLLTARPESGDALIAMLAVGLIAGLLALIARVRYQPESSPIPLPFFQRRTLFPVIVLVLLSSAALYASVTLLPLALSQQPTAVPTGLLVMLAALGWVVGAAICGARLALAGYRRMAAAGMLMLAIGGLLMAWAISQQQPWLMATSLLLTGLGMGFTATATLVLAQNAAPPERLGTWTATVQFLRNLGAALGVNILATMQLHLSGLHAFPICFIILGASMLTGLIFTLLLPRAYPAK